MEKLFREETVSQNRLVERVTVIIDLSGLGLKHIYTPALQVLRKIASLGEGFHAFLSPFPSVLPTLPSCPHSHSFSLLFSFSLSQLPREAQEVLHCQRALDFPQDLEHGQELL